MTTNDKNTELQLRVAGAVALAAVAASLGIAVARQILNWPVWIIVAVTVGVLVVVAGGLAATYRWWGQTQSMRALRNTSALGEVTGRGAVSKGAELRGLDTETGSRGRMLAAFGIRSASAGEVDPREVATLIGKVGKRAIYKTLEDFTLIIMGPRSNKTSSQAVPRILSALGAVVATSNKPDLWILTSRLRRQKGPVYGYDPGNIGFIEQTWWWNILDGITTFNAAKRVATHFMAGVGIDGAKGNSGFFDSGSKQMLARCLLAAAVSGRSMRDVMRWIDTYSREPVQLLKDHGHGRAADALDSQLDLPHETLGGIQGGASSALECLQDEAALRWVTPPTTWEQAPDREIEELDLWTLFTARPAYQPTLYLMTQEGAESSGPVVAAMVDQIFKLADLAASAQGGRIDPPLTVVLDEAANICRIEDLPAKASHLGSKGVSVDVILQSYRQGIGVWGQERMGALWGASTCRIIGAGLQDRDDARMISDLIGTHEVWKDSYNYGPGGRSRSRSKVREPIMPLEDVAALDRSHGVLVRQGSKPVMIDLLPWYRETEAGDISADQETSIAEVRNSAIAALGDTVLGQHLRDTADDVAMR